MKYIGLATVIVIQIFLTMLTVSTLWAWFIVPLGVTGIGLAHSYGLAIILTFITMRSTPTFAPEVLQNLTMSQKLGRALGINLSVLLFGWIATLFM